MAELIVLRDGRELARARLGSAALALGRDAASDLVLDDPRASRRHARVEPRADGFYFVDAGSSHGSLLGGRELKEHRLADGDVIRIGGLRLCFVAGDGAPAPAEPAPSPEPAALDTWPGLEAILDRAGEGGQSARLLRALCEISLALDSAEEFESVLDRIMDKALRIMGAERGFILLKDEGGELKVHSARDRRGPIAGVTAEGVSRSLITKVLGSGEPVLVADATRAGEWRTQSMVANSIHSALCVPLKGSAGLAGVIYVDHRSRALAFTETDLAFFTTFSVQAKTAIDSSRAYWELVDGLFGASGDFVAVCAPDGRIARVSRGAAELLGLPAENLPGRALSELVEGGAAAPAALLGEVAERGRAAGRELRLRAADGRLVPLDVSGFALRDRAGAPTGACLIGRDLTASMSLIEDLKSATARLFELNNMKSEFVGMIAHELKSPLSVVIGYAQLLLERGPADDPARARKSLESVLEAASRAEGLIEELLELNRLETGGTPLALETADAAGLLRAAAEAVALEARKRRVTVELRLPERLPPLRCDPKLMRRAFENLASNGVKYNKEDGRLALSARAAVGRVEFLFADEGIGLSPEELKSLFKQFYRAEAARASREGTGLGLSIVKAIVERHGGSIRVDSAPGRGSTFAVSLPLGGH